MPPPSLATLTARFLAHQATSPSDGTLPEVQPHEVVTSFRTDSSVMWTDAKAPFELFGVKASVPMPPEWSAFVAQLSDVAVMPLCLGSVPQRMRDLSGAKPQLTATGHSMVGGHFAKLTKWIDSCRKTGSAGERLMAAAFLRTMGDFDAAETLLKLAEPDCTSSLAMVLANERAAILWHRGDLAGASAGWQAMGDGPVAAFNCGVCEWMLGRPSSAAALFDRAAGSIPDRSGWSHLAAFYASICEDA